MIFFSDPIQTLLPSVVYLAVLLLVLLVIAFRSSTDSLLYRVRYVFIILFFWIYLTSTPMFANLLILNLEERYPVIQVSKRDRNPDNLIVVLASGRVRNTIEGNHADLDEAGWHRTQAAIELWRQIGGRLLFNGGPTAHNGHSAADRMADLARSTGVPASAIIVDGRARDTYENLLYTVSQIDRNRHRVWLVTSAMHLPRTMAVASNLGVSATAFPCDFRGNKKLGWRGWLPHHKGPIDFERALHELFGMLYYRLRGWI